MVGCALLIDVHRHVTAHLPALKVAPKIHALAYLRSPLIAPPFLPFRRISELRCLNILLAHIERPLASIDACAAYEMEWACRRAALGKSHTCSLVAAPLEFKMEKHDELLRLGIVYHLRTFHYATALNVVTVVAAYGERYAFVLPMAHVGRRVNADASFSGESSIGAVLAIPVIRIAILDDVASMGIDMFAIHIIPELSVDKVLS